MTDRYSALLLALLPISACSFSKSGETGHTGDTGGNRTDTSDTSDSGLPPTRSESGCYTLDTPGETCPPPSEVPPSQVTPATCGAEVLSVDGAGTAGECSWIGGDVENGWCIYPITVQPPRPEDECDYGRPLTIDGAPRMAMLVRGGGWTKPPGQAAPDADRAARWARVALAEHASVGSFARVALELLHLGAPAALLAEVQAAGADEVRHARLAFGLASRFAGTTLGPGPLPLTDLRLTGDLAAFAAATVREGCIAETLSALMVGEAAEHSDDAEERAVLAVLARDEAKHAQLAWQIVRWALDTGGSSVRAAVSEAFRDAPRCSGQGGLLPEEAAREVVRRGWAEVIQPAAAAMLGGDAGLADSAR